MIRFLGRAVIVILILVAILWSAVAVNNKARLWVAKNYFRYEDPKWTPRLITARFLRPVRMQVERGVSLNLDPGDLVSHSILATREWQPEVWNSLNASLPEGGVMLDVGAHIGYFTLKGAAKAGPNGRVIAFEPNPETIAELKSNIEISGVSKTVTIEPIACTDRDQQLTLYAAHNSNTGASSLSKDNATAFDEAAKPYSVRGRPIDDVVRELGLTRLDVMKVDVEGAEVSVMRGALETLKRFHPMVVIEIDERQLAGFGTKPDDLTAIFHEAGYEFSRQIDDSDWEWYALAPENTQSVIQAGNPLHQKQLLNGFFSAESGSWRWTAREFSLTLRVPPALATPSLTLSLVVPKVVLERLGGSTTLHASVNGVELRPETYSTEGAGIYRRALPDWKPSKDPRLVTIRFSLERAISPGNGDPRSELGILVTGASIQ